jgi:5-methyltetrahydropteroyltriglutamate--homocysteine methyltransferase
MLLPTSLVGSYPQPGWLIDRERLSVMVPPRARARDLWRVDDAALAEALDDAALLAIRDQERAGLDIITDGEVRRESYSNYFATALEGMDSDHPAEIPGRSPGRLQIVPRVVGRIRRTGPVEAANVAFLRANTDRIVKVTLPGPFTMSQQLLDEHYGDEGAVAMDCAVAINEEIRDVFAAGADIVQLDEPFLQARPEKAREFAIAAINRAVDGAQGTTAVHLCFGYAIFVKNRPASGYSFLPELDGAHIDQVSIETAQSKLDCAVLAELASKTIILGVIDLVDHAVETADEVAARIRRALPHVPAERIVVAPDCGMKYLPRPVAFAKAAAMAEGAAIVRRELSG